MTLTFCVFLGLVSCPGFLKDERWICLLDEAKTFWKRCLWERCGIASPVFAAWVILFLP
ncbi:MAG TPA: hypothetical protein VFN35_22500 [Ktedonobacteraceae bacterium]|nr:hypothetical protein [Ktedonobacteraceae bacterium]